MTKQTARKSIVDELLPELLNPRMTAILVQLLNDEQKARLTVLLMAAINEVTDDE